MMEPVEKGGFGFTKEQIGTILSAFTLTYGPSKFIGGVVSDIVSPRLIFTFCVASAGAANLSFGAASNLSIFVSMWALHGLVQGLGWPALSAILIKWYPKEQLGTMWGLCTTAGNVGQSIAPMLLTALALQLGWQAAFIGPAVCGCVGSAVLWMLIRDQPEDVGLEPVSISKTADEAGPSMLQVLRTHLLTDGHFWLLCVADALVYLVLKGLSNWTINFLLEARNFSKMQAASAATAFEVGGIVGTNAACQLSDRLGGRRNLANIIFVGACVPGLGVLWLTPDANTLQESSFTAMALGLASSFFLGAAINGPKAVCGIAAREMSHPKAAGTAGGILGLAGQIGASFAGYPLVMLQKDYGWAGVFLGLLGSSLLAVLLFVPLVMSEVNASQKKKTK